MTEKSEKKRNWFRRHWLIVTITIIALIIASSFINNSFNPKQDSNNSESKINSAVVSGSLESFFPIRSEIPTEFTITPISDSDITNIKNAEGLKSVKSMSIDKIEGSMGSIVIDMTIDEFSSQEQAKKYYDFLVNEHKQAGGYSEMSISSHSTCFGYTEDYGISAQYANVLCYNKNIWFEVAGVSGNTFKKPNNDVKTMVSIIDGKIK
jgi:hypothetical protein